MFIILAKPHEDIHEQLDPEEINTALIHLRAGQLDVREEEYQALRYALSKGICHMPQHRKTCR